MARGPLVGDTVIEVKKILHPFNMEISDEIETKMFYKSHHTRFV